MESLRLLQRRTVQQLLQTRPSSQNFRLLHQSSKQPFRTRPTKFSTFSRISHAPRLSPSPFIRATRRTLQQTARRFESTTAETAANENLSLTQRMKRLSREYGWSALGVYLMLTALDFPFCFLAVRLIGTDKIGHWEHVVVTWIKETITYPMAGGSDAQDQVEDASQQVETVVRAPLEDIRDGEKRVLEEGETYVVADHGYKEAEKAATGANASLWTQLVLAYAIHKSFIFIRVPLTAAVTPKVVKTLRGWGWNIGKIPKRESFRRPTSSTSGTGVNAKGTGIKPDD